MLETKFAAGFKADRKLILKVMIIKELGNNSIVTNRLVSFTQQADTEWHQNCSDIRGWLDTISLADTLDDHLPCS